ncbi:MAG: enoyl-CoA hydratase [Burkholderiales bacterium]|jgi:enoyl-CoA hydratase/carnithine racemase|nr:enoyl-CoA hydratase [Burkholderiales bacterium]
MTQAPGRVTTRIDGPIGWIVFENPGRHNAMSVAMWEALPAAVDALQADPQVRVLVLRGAGDQAFVSGADISQFDQVRDSLEANQRYEAMGNAGMMRIADCSKPTIAMLQGWCLGGGMAITLNCDLRIGDESLRYGIPAARLGIGYRWPGIKKLVDTVGAPNAREIFLTARRFNAQDALRMGFVNRIVARGELEAAVRAECDLLAANAPLTMASVKVAIDEILRAGPQIDAQRIEAATQRAYGSADFIEGRHAFLEKRPPVFQGR